MLSTQLGGGYAKKSGLSPCREPPCAGNALPEHSRRTQCNLYCGPRGGACGSRQDSPFCLDPLSPGSFHLIHLMFDDYVLYLLESLHCQERANELMRAMKGEGSTGKPASPGRVPPWGLTCILTSVLPASLALYPEGCSYGEQVTWCETRDVLFHLEWACGHWEWPPMTWW